MYKVYQLNGWPHYSAPTSFTVSIYRFNAICNNTAWIVNVVYTARFKRDKTRFGKNVETLTQIF